MVPGRIQQGGFPGILFRYDYQISREMLASWLKMIYEPYFPFAAIDSIFIPLEAVPVHFINSSTEEKWLMSVSLPREVLELAVTNPRDTFGYKWNALQPGDNFAAAVGVYDIAGPEVMVVPAWGHEEVDYDALVHSFYLTPSLIKEPDGTEIYTDGLQALRIYPSGAVEYTFAGYERDLSMPIQKDLVKASLRFVSAHGGWLAILCSRNGSPSCAECAAGVFQLRIRPAGAGRYRRGDRDEGLGRQRILPQSHRNSARSD